MATILHIRNMVCKRCIKVVRDEFELIGVEIANIELGRVSVATPLTAALMSDIESMLTHNGFELIDDKKSQLIDSIKTLIIEMVHHKEEGLASTNSSDYLAKSLGYDYSYISHLFSSVEGITIEKYTINQKIEKVKELLVYDELTLNEISYQLGYSSVQHLSAQFKRVTGLTPSQFKKQKNTSRLPLDEV